MNTRSMSFRMFLPALLVALMIGVQGAGAQHPETLAKVTVPFAFEYGTHAFTAGTYQIAMVSDDIMIVRGEHNSALALVRREDGNKQPSNGKLVFHRSVAGYVLRDVWVPSRSAHLVCPKGKQHRERELVEAKPAGPDVEVAMLEVPR